LVRCAPREILQKWSNQYGSTSSEIILRVFPLPGEALKIYDTMPLAKQEIKSLRPALAKLLRTRMWRSGKFIKLTAN